MLATLPPEVLLHILSFLPIYDVLSIQLVSGLFNALVDLHSASVYRTLAIFHGIACAEDVDVNNLLKQRNVYFDWLKPSRVGWRQPPSVPMTWKHYVTQHFLLEKVWSRGATNEYRRRSNPTRPHRIQIDEEEGTIISTHGIRQIQVEDIMHEIPLWVKPMAPAWAHCEFDKGFLIWGRNSAEIEVWRRRKDQLLNPLPACSPDGLQLASQHIAPAAELSEEELLAAFYADESDLSDNADSPRSRVRDSEYRGQFTPFCVLTPPRITSASRFIYPELVVVTRDATNAYIFDVPNAKLVRTIELETVAEDTVCYVDHSPTHVFVCTVFTVTAYRKSDGKCDMRFTREQLSPNQVYNAVVRTGEHSCSLTRLEDVASNEDAMVTEEEFLAVHVSPCGRIWVLIRERKHLYICTGGFESGKEPLNMTRIDLPGREFYYLAFDGKNVAVAGESIGIATLSLKRLQNAGKPLSAIHESISKSTLAFKLPSGVQMQHTSCLQVTDTAVWHVAATDSHGIMGTITAFSHGAARYISYEDEEQTLEDSSDSDSDWEDMEE